MNPGSVKVNTDEDQESNEMYLLQYFPLNRSDSKDEIVEYSALMKSIEGSLAQPVSLRQRSPMQKKHRSYLSTSEPSSSPDKPSDDHHNLLPDSAEIESIVQEDGVIQPQLGGFRSQSLSPNRSESTSPKVSLGPGSRARLLMSSTAPLSGSASLIERILEGESKSPDGDTIASGSATTARRSKNRRTRRGPGSHLQSEEF